MLSYFRFHHIGYAVKEIAVTAEYYIKAGWRLSEQQIDLIQNTKIAFLSKEGFPLIEFVAPVDDTSPVVKILEKRGVTTYHICYEVDDINSSVSELRKQKFVQLFKPVEAVALNNQKICYLFNKDVGLIELVEIKQ